MSFSVADIRKDFAVLSTKVHGKPLVYFDNAATTQKPRPVIEAIAQYYAEAANVHRGVHYLSEKATIAYENARTHIARFIGAEAAKNIVFTRGTTEAINLVAHCFTDFVDEGDEIIISEMEHHSNIVPWYLLAERKNLKLRVIPLHDDGSLDLDAFKSLFNERTKLLAISHASNVLGVINPLQSMIAHAHEKNVAVLVDGAQGLPHFGVDVRSLGADFYCFSAHKSYGPTGIGVLYAKSSWLERFKPYQSGGNMIASVSFDDISFAEAPYKFEAGTPNIAGALGFSAALNYLEQLGLKDIERYEHELHDYAYARLKEILCLRLIGDGMGPRVCLFSFVHERVHAHDLSSILDREGIAIRAGHLCAQPLMKRFKIPACARMSLSFYNTHEEIEVFIKAFKRVAEVFGL